MDDFYIAFEERYYAPRDVIKQLRQQYLPFILPLVELYPGGRAYDAGCGRGEWLELMLETGFTPFGVDLDDGMLRACKERGLNGIKGDAIEHISKLADNSVVVVSAFHVVEHISFDSLRQFVSHALRVLAPGGLLIMETPNPENIVVATRNFYLDPTHQKPIPCQLLAFLAENAEFETVKTIRMQENKSILEKVNITINDVFTGVSPDYAVIAQKSAQREVLASFEDVFSKDFGVSLDDLLFRFDTRLEARLQSVEVNLQNTQSQIESLYTSTSWRITAPLRWFGQQIHLLKQHSLKKRFKALCRKILQHFISFINNKPRLKRHVGSTARSLGLEKILRPIYMSSTLDLSLQNLQKELNHLTPSSKDIYQQLKSAVKNKKRQN